MTTQSQWPITEQGPEGNYHRLMWTVDSSPVLSASNSSGCFPLVVHLNQDITYSIKTHYSLAYVEETPTAICRICIYTF